MKKNPPVTKGVKWVSGEPTAVLKELSEMGYSSALLGGGTYLNTLFLEKKLIDEIILTVEPLIFGNGLSLFSKDFDINLTLQEVKQINKNTVLLRYKVHY